MRLVPGIVKEILFASNDLQVVNVSCEGSERQACNYLALGAAVAVDDTVLLNTTAVDLQLGTGGVHFVVPNKAVETDTGYGHGHGDGSSGNGHGDGSSVLFSCEMPPATASSSENRTDEPFPCPFPSPDAPPPSPGHIIKLRYTPLQLNVLAVEEPASKYHELLRDAHSVEGMPVVCCALHSQVPLVAAAVRSLAPQARIAYCMTDEAALPLANSWTVRAARESGLLNTIISCGQAFGGELEAVTLYSGLLAAHFVAHADVAIVAIGPGTVGTATAFGHTGVAQGLALNAAAALDGVPVCALRVSFTDARERHRGVSQHSLTALTSVCLAEAVVALPDSNSLPREQLIQLEQTLEQAGVYSQHGVIPLSVERERINLRGLVVTTMGRSEAEDPAFFQTSFAAGILAAKLAGERGRMTKR